MEPLSVKKNAQCKHETEDFNQHLERKYTYHHDFDIKYEQLSPIIKDLQMVSQLIKYVKINQLSDLIFINGTNSYTIDSRFYFNYRYIIDFYLKVIDVVENDSCISIKYYIYKTTPISKNFVVILTICKNDENENSSKLDIEIVLSKDVRISEKILNIIYSEFDYNYLYLSQAIKSQKQNSFFINSDIIKNEFNILSQIIQNVKLIEYIINGKFQKVSKVKKEKFNNSENNDFINADDDKFIHLNDIYEVILNNKQKRKNWASENKTLFKIQRLKTRKDKIIIEIQVSLNYQEIEKNDCNVYNLINIQMYKLTNNSSFMLIKGMWDYNMPEDLVFIIQKIVKKYLNKIGKLCQIAKDKYNF